MIFSRVSCEETLHSPRRCPLLTRSRVYDAPCSRLLLPSTSLIMQSLMLGDLVLVHRDSHEVSSTFPRVYVIAAICVVQGIRFRGSTPVRRLISCAPAQANFRDFLAACHPFFWVDVKSFPRQQLTLLMFSRAHSRWAARFHSWVCPKGKWDSQISRVPVNVMICHSC